jgi:hypothetical protein
MFEFSINVESDMGLKKLVIQNENAPTVWLGPNNCITKSITSNYEAAVLTCKGNRFLSLGILLPLTNVIKYKVCQGLILNKMANFYSVGLDKSRILATFRVGPCNSSKYKDF